MRRTSIIMSLANYALTRITTTVTRVLHFQGEDMAPNTATRAPAAAQPIVTVDEIDEALLHTSMALHRDEHWTRWTDALLDQRLRLSRPGREVRVVCVDETRGH